MGADHQARWAGAWGGEGSKREVVERRWRRLGVDDAYGRRGEREARWCLGGKEAMDMELRWRTWRRPGERERRWLGLGVEDACGLRFEV